MSFQDGERGDPAPRFAPLLLIVPSLKNGQGRLFPGGLVFCEGQQISNTSYDRDSESGPCGRFGHAIPFGHFLGGDWARRGCPTGILVTSRPPNCYGIGE